MPVVGSGVKGKTGGGLHNGRHGGAGGIPFFAGELGFGLFCGGVFFYGSHTSKPACVGHPDVCFRVLLTWATRADPALKRWANLRPSLTGR